MSAFTTTKDVSLNLETKATWKRFLTVSVALLPFLTPAASVATPYGGSLRDGFRVICESVAEKSDKLNTACQAGEMPKVIKDGTRFANVGIGSELNTLIRNIEFFTKQ